MRIWEIDFARGLAVILMLIYHSFFDCHFFDKIQLSYEFLNYFPRFVGATFIFISGYTMAVVKPNRSRIFKKVLKLASLALLISLVTFILFKEKMVYFGILHFFALATLISSPFVKFPKFSAVFGVVTILGYYLINPLTFDSYTLVWLGVVPKDFETLDYYPLIPNFGYMLLGISAGSFHSNKTNVKTYRDPISFLGRNSLKIYLIQHPIIVALLCLIYPDVFERVVDTVEFY